MRFDIALFIFFSETICVFIIQEYDFILHDLDETHLLIKPGYIEMIQERIDEFLDNCAVVPQERGRRIS